MSRAMVLSGGASRGAVQVPIAMELAIRYEYDAVYGVSVGSLNGALVAQGDLELMYDIWNSIDGVSSFMRPSLWPFNGLYSMRPLRKLIEAHTALDKMQIPFSAGVVSLRNKEYYNLCTNDMIKNRELWDALEASSSISGLMKSPDIEINGRVHKGADGGFRNIVPTPVLAKYKYIDVLPCTPLDRGNIEPSDQWNFLSLFGRGIEVMEDETFERDYLQIAGQLAPGGSMTVYAPLKDTGEPFDASRKTIRRRFRLGEEAFKYPETITYDEYCVCRDAIDL